MKFKEFSFDLKIIVYFKCIWDVVSWSFSHCLEKQNLATPEKANDPDSRMCLSYLDNVKFNILLT